MTAADKPKLVPLTIRIGDPAMTFDVDVRPADHAWFALGIRKSGSSIFSNIVAALAMYNGLNAVDIPGTFFKHGFRYPDWNGYERINDLVWRGNAYVGFRDPPTAFFKDPVFVESRKMLVVRDPRDALVSEYYSNAFSHSLPAGPAGGSVVERERERALGVSVEDYVLGRVDALERTVSGYQRLLDDSNLLILKYEDVVLDKAGWIARIADHFGWSTSDKLITDMLGWADVRPTAEQPTAFVRRVTPGDHLDKLSPDGIEAINRRLSNIWRGFGYAVGG